MRANQIKEIVQSAVNQARGADAVTLTDTSDIISLGDRVFAEGWQNDFLSSLTDVIGKTIIVNRPYSAQVKGLMKDYFTFGAILRKLDCEPLTADDDRAWTLNTGASETIGGTNDGYNAGIFVIKKPTVYQTLFSSFNVWSFEVTIPDRQLRSAFHSAEEMAAFIDAIMVALQNSITESIDAIGRLVFATYAGIKCVETYATGATAHTAINLLADYNTLNPDNTLTAAEAVANPDFMRYACKIINLYVKRMQDMSVLYNGEGRKRFTPKEDQVLTLNSDFVAAYETYLMSTTFHENLVELGQYDEVNFWQGSGTAYGDHEKINVTTPSFAIGEGDPDTWTVSADGVIGILSDTRALGATVYDRYSATERDNLKQIAQYKEAANIGWYIDRSENGVVFLVADDDPTVTGSADAESEPAADAESKRSKKG